VRVCTSRACCHELIWISGFCSEFSDGFGAISPFPSLLAPQLHVALTHHRKIFVPRTGPCRIEMLQLLLHTSPQPAAGPKCLGPVQSERTAFFWWCPAQLQSPFGPATPSFEWRSTLSGAQRSRQVACPPRSLGALDRHTAARRSL
jgi:hypothetical protein